MNPGSDMPEKDKRRVFRSRPALRDMRLRAGLTEQALAARLGVTYHTIQAWERGQRAVRKGWDFKLAEALGCNRASSARRFCSVGTLLRVSARAGSFSM